MVTLSTYEAKYVAAATAACQVVWLRRLLGELTSVEAHPPALMVDNQPVIVLAKNLVLHDWSKHIDVKFHFIRDYVDGGQIVIEFIETGRQLAAARTSLTHRAEGDDRHGGGTRVSSRIRGRLLANLLPPCENTAQEGGADLAACCV